MPVPQRIPLPLRDDRGERVVLQQQHAVGSGRLRAPRERSALVRFVHDAEAVQHHVGPRRRCSSKPRSVSSGIQVPPCGLPNSRTVLPRQPTRRGDPLDRRLGLVPQRLRLDAARLVGDGVVVGQLRQAAVPAQVHRQRVRRLVGAHRIRRRAESGRRRERCRDRAPDSSADSPHPRHSVMTAFPCAHRRRPTSQTFSSSSRSRSATTAACSPGRSTRTSSTTTSAAPGTAASFVQDSQSRSAQGRDPRHARTLRARRGEAGPLRQRRGARCAGRHPKGLADLRPAAGIPARRQRLSASVRAARLPARLPGADRRRPMSATGSIGRMIPPRIWRSRTTTRTLRSTGRCRSRWSRRATRAPGAGPSCSHTCRDPSHRCVENALAREALPVRQPGELLGEVLGGQARRRCTRL